MTGTSTLTVLSNFITNHPNLFALFLIWTLAWKGWALWRSAELQQKWWFIILLVVNTGGLLEIIYIFFIARKYKVEVVES